MGVKKFHLETDVLTEARKRMAWVFDNFKTVYVSFSGGKDSTVVLHLALEEAERRGRLPLSVMWIDQEAEWQSVVDYVKTIMYNPKVKPYWLQVPIRMTNNSSTLDEWLYVWDERSKDKWIHPKDPIAIHRNVYGVDRFKKLFGGFLNYHHFAEYACSVGGVRCEESPGRTLALTVGETAKGVTWGSGQGSNPRHFVFYPIYDWSYRDVWKAIHDHGWEYCKVYDLMYQYGVPIRGMRVSNVHHETALMTLQYLQEIEPETWERITARLGGINSAGHLRGALYPPNPAPWMFASMKEYRDYLIEHLITNTATQEYFRKTFARFDQHYTGKVLELLHYFETNAVCINDTSGTTLANFQSAYGKHDILRGTHGARSRGATKG